MGHNCDTQDHSEIHPEWNTSGPAYSARQIAHELSPTLSPSDSKAMRGTLASVSLLVATVFGFGLTMYGASQSRQGAQNRIVERKQQGRRREIDWIPHRTTAKDKIPALHAWV
jgi:hypothetical protein